MLRDPHLDALMAAHRQFGCRRRFRILRVFCATPHLTCRSARLRAVMRATRVMRSTFDPTIVGPVDSRRRKRGAGSDAFGAGPSGCAAPALPVDKDMGAWLKRMQEAPRRRAYAGTYVVSSSAGALSSARIWHVCDGSQRMERIEALTGAPRSTFRRNDEVLTFARTRKPWWPKTRSAGLVSNRQIVGDKAIAEHYTLQAAGSERVAGHDADVVQLVPRDALALWLSGLEREKDGAGRQVADDRRLGAGSGAVGLL
jgi:hypothetical protein